MKIAILGSGDVGQSLAQGFLSRGHEVMMGSREPRSDRLEQWRAAAGPKASTGTFAEAARFAELAVLAVPWSAVASAIELSAPENLRGKIVIDVTNPLKSEEGKPPGLAVGHIDSAGETVARSLPGAKVVKAFNSVGHELMVDPKLPGGPPTMFIAGDDEGAKKTVGAICRDFGWEVADLGGIEASRLLEPLCIVWVLYGRRTGAWNHAFKMLHGA